jgi:hypothetical protein
MEYMPRTPCRLAAFTTRRNPSTSVGVAKSGQGAIDLSDGGRGEQLYRKKEMVKVNSRMAYPAESRPRYAQDPGRVCFS